MRKSWHRNPRTGSWISPDGRWVIRPAYESSIRGGSVSRPSYWVCKDTHGVVPTFDRRYLSDAKSYADAKGQTTCTR